jgi:ankyrin repeat protein
MAFPCSALYYAALNGDTARVRGLLKTGNHDVAVNGVFGGGDETALSVAARIGWRHVVEHLLARWRANEHTTQFKEYVNAQYGMFGYTPLMGAVAGGHLRVVRLLLAAGARVTDKAYYGPDALSIAAEHGHLEVAVVLLEAGADIDAVDPIRPEDYTAEECAKAHGHEDVAAYLARWKAACTIQKETRRRQAVVKAIRMRFAAFRIKRFWRDVTYNPAYALCRRRLLLDTQPMST